MKGSKPHRGAGPSTKMITQTDAKAVFAESSTTGGGWLCNGCILVINHKGVETSKPSSGLGRKGKAPSLNPLTFSDDVIKAVPHENSTYSDPPGCR